MSGPVQAKPANDLFINLALGTLTAAAGFTGLLRVAGSVAAFLPRKQTSFRRFFG